MEDVAESERKYLPKNRDGSFMERFKYVRSEVSSIMRRSHKHFNNFSNLFSYFLVYHNCFSHLIFQMSNATDQVPSFVRTELLPQFSPFELITDDNGNVTGYEVKHPFRPHLSA